MSCLCLARSALRKSKGIGTKGDERLRGKVLKSLPYQPTSPQTRAIAEIAGDMATQCSPLVMGIHKRLLWKGQAMEREPFIELETKALHYTMGKPDAIEGGMAFFERRDPNWTSSVADDWPEWL